MSNDTKCQITQNVLWQLLLNDTKCQMTRNVKWHEMSNDTKCQNQMYNSKSEDFLRSYVL